MNIKLKDNDLTTLPGVGVATKGKLEELGIKTITDIILFLPSHLLDKTSTSNPNNVTDKQKCIFIGVIKNIIITKGPKRSMIVKVNVDGIDLQIRFLHKIFMFSNLKIGLKIRITGVVYKQSKTLSMIHPEVEIMSSDGLEKIIPFYDTKKKVTQGKIRKIIKFLLDYLSNKNNKDIFMDDQLLKLEIPNYLDALLFCHLPSSKISYNESLEKFLQGRKRFIFEELLAHRIKINTEINSSSKQTGYKFDYEKSDIHKMISTLGFSLTDSQIDVLNDLEKDFSKGTVSKRLIQGDVGCGKTIVAALAAYMCYLSDLQTSLLVPTEILANQHYKSLLKIFDGTKINIELITSSVCKSDKDVIYEKISSGEINIIIGTHSLLSDNIRFKNLGLSIIDEQHKFGVRQRAQIHKSSNKTIQPHQIMLSATPIPRSLSLVLYEGLSYSRITDVPKGRKPVKTELINKINREAIFDFVKDAINSKQQIFWMCPAIDSNSDRTSNIYGVYEELIEIFPSDRVAILHGQAEQSENEINMRKFHKHDADILLCTTMIEVGINIPNATTIIIEDASRFGLSQLHQLRGRVGRGRQQGFCFLIYDEKSSELSLSRLESLVNTNDGFSIAETDLKLRGAGDYFGQRQSGQYNNFKLINYEEILDNFTEVKKINKIYSELTDTQKKILLSRWSQLGNKGIDL